MPWWDSETVVEYNVQKVKDILAQAGWKNTENDGILEKMVLKRSLLYYIFPMTQQDILQLLMLNKN